MGRRAHVDSGRSWVGGKSPEEAAEARMEGDGARVQSDPKAGT